MSSLFLSNLNNFDFNEEYKRIDFEAESKELLIEIDESKVCCSTPKNKFDIFFRFQPNLINVNISEQEKLKPSTYSFKSRVSSSASDVLPLNNTNQTNGSDEINSLNTKESESQFNKIFQIVKVIDRKNMKKKINLSSRQDVVNKSILRQMRKYYLNVFKNTNSKIVRLRFCNVKSSEITRAIKGIISREFESESYPNDLHYYLIGILKIKDVSRMKCDLAIKRDVSDFLNCTREYSNIKFESLFKSICLRTLFKNFISKIDRNNQIQSLQPIIESNQKIEERYK